jgi:hypothetical protein
VLKSGDIKEELEPIQLHLKVSEQPIGLHIVEHVGLPEEHHIPVISINPLVDFLMERGIAEINRAAFTEVAAEESVEFIKKFLSEFWELLQGFLYVLSQFWENAVFVIPGFDGHQVDIPGLAFNLRPYENIP